MKLNIELFERLNGTSPIKEFIDELPEKAQAKVLRTLELLEEYGPEMGMPHVKSLSGIRGAWEVRVKFNTKYLQISFYHKSGYGSNIACFY